MTHPADLPAFPFQPGDGWGVTMLDFYAAAAMQGEIAAQSPELGVYSDIGLLARNAFDIAEAMLEEKEKRRGRS